MALSNPFKGKSTEEIASIFDRVYKNTWQQPAARQDNLTAEDISKGVVVRDYLRDLQATRETFGG